MLTRKEVSMTRGKHPGKSAAQNLASLGGLARAESLTKQERSAIAKRAAEERWAVAKGLPRETHTGILQIGAGIPCSVLSNQMRVFSVNGLVRAFNGGAKGRSTFADDGTKVPPVLVAANLRPFISADLRANLESPVMFRGKHGGRDGVGYEATIIRKICDVFLDARAAGVLRKPQLRLALSAERLLRAFADVGIIALVDEATGYQDDRARDELQRLVEAYVVEDMRPWVGLFPGSFFKQIYRIHGWKYQEGITQGPRYVGKFINKYVYRRLPAPVLDRLRELNPVIDKRRRHKHFQFLTEDIGEPTVDRHLASVTTLMSVAKDKNHFDDMFRIAFPKPGEQLLLPGVIVEEVGDDEPSLTVSDRVVVGGIGIVSSDEGVRTRILGRLSGGNTVGSGDLAEAVYGDRGGGTLNKLRKRMASLRQEGLVESPSKGIWKLSSGSRA